MKRNLQLLASVLRFIAIGILFSSALCLAVEFSADFVDTKAGRTNSGKVYLKGDKVRREVTEGPRKGTITIYRLDKEVVWVLNPAQKTYTEMPGMGKQIGELSLNDPRVQDMLKKLGELKPAGTETVNGYVCDKYALVYHEKAMGTQYQWIAQKLNVPIKIEHQGSRFSMLIEYKNINEGQIPDSLFELPPGYRKMAIPGFN